MKPILECKGLSKKYNKNAYALHNLNLTPVSYTHLFSDCNRNSSGSKVVTFLN